jgi:hypothetical protein
VHHDHEFGNRIPLSYLKKLYGEDHWMFCEEEDEKVPDDLARFLRDEL